MDTRETVSAIVQRQRFRAAAIKAQIRIGNMARSLVRCGLGWRWELPEKDRTAINRRAERIVKVVHQAQDAHDVLDGPDRSVADAYRPFILACKLAAAPFDSIRETCEKEMVELAKTLPCAQHVEDTVGFGYLGLAVLVGEAGDIGAYRSPAGLWKRFGVAPSPCYEMKDKQGNLCIAKPKRRRSVLYTVGDSLIKGNHDGYRALYDGRKAYEYARNPEIKPIIAHRRAQRYMEKRLLKHLWQCWRGQPVLGPHTQSAPPAATEPDAEKGRAVVHTIPSKNTPARSAKRKAKGPARTPAISKEATPAPSPDRKKQGKGRATSTGSPMPKPPSPSPKAKGGRGQPGLDTPAPNAAPAQP